MIVLFIVWKTGLDYTKVLTNFKNGDQLNIRFTGNINGVPQSAGRTRPVSYDGREDANYFPLVFRIFGQ